MVTQTIHVGDCELLEHYMDVTDASNPKWRNWDDREWLEGLSAHAILPNVYRGGAPGLTECVNGWRGLTPLAMNPCSAPPARAPSAWTRPSWPPCTGPTGRT
jgi:hypothetical protein